MEINGKELAREIIDELKEVRKKYNKLKIAVFLIGETQEKVKFLEMKKKVANELDIEMKIYSPPQPLSRKKIRTYIHSVVKYKSINGALIQLPLPKELLNRQQYILNSIPAYKDIDCLSSRNLGKFFTNQYFIRPPSVEVVDFLKNKLSLNFQGKNILIVGYGNLIGRPLTHYFCQERATTTVINEYTLEPENYFDKADIIVSGVGVPLLINNCKKGAIIFDFGTKVVDGKIVGDVDIEKIKTKAKIYTPTPGGTGPLLIAMLFKNFFKLLSLKAKW